MQSVKEEGREDPGVKVGSTVTQRSPSQEKKVIVFFRHGKDRDQPGVSGLPNVPAGMPGGQESIAQPVQSPRDGDMRVEMGNCRRSRMTQEDMEFFYSAMVEVRDQ